MWAGPNKMQSKLESACLAIAAPNHCTHWPLHQCCYAETHEGQRWPYNLAMTHIVRAAALCAQWIGNACHSQVLPLLL